MNKAALFAIIGTVMFLLSAGSAFAATPSTTTVHIQPDPTMNVNATWSTFYSGWSSLEYNNGTGNASLPAGMSTSYANPITINPADIHAPKTFTNSWAGQNWLNVSDWTATANYGAVTSVSNTSGIITVKANSSESGTVGVAITGNTALLSSLPSSNLEYVYETIAGHFAMSAPITGANAQIYADNGTANYVQMFINGTNAGNATQMGSERIGEIQPGQSFYLTVPISDFYQNGHVASLAPRLAVVVPQATSSTIYVYLNVTAAALTTSPLSLGTQGNNPVYASLGNAKLTTFSPNFAWSEITNNGYTVAISQLLQNLSTQQNAISSGNYIEQVEYQGQFDLPTAPDLSYGPANLTEAFNISTAQTQVLDINGVSYLSTIANKNGTIELLASINPNSQTQILQIVDYTQSQWNSISVAPGIFTIAGIEYYWWIAVGGLATLIGLAAAAKHAGTKADQERIRRGR